MEQSDKKDDFKPEKLIGKKLFFQCQEQSVEPVILELGEIVKHYKLYKRSWTYKGRGDLVIYQVLNSNYKEHSLDYVQINQLIEKGVFQDRYGLVYRIVK